MRGARASLALLLAAAACSPTGEAPVSEDEGLLPGGYAVALDADRSDPGDFRITEEDEFLRFTTGPGGIAWRREDVVEQGDFLAEATFTLFNAPPGYREAFGVFVGGRDLDGAAQRYTYLVVRPAGDFMVQRRRGDVTEVLVDWTGHPAVQRVTEDGAEPVNVVGILVAGERASFLVNGTEVHQMPAAEVQPWGTAGLRINHRLDLRVAAWYLGAPPLQTGT